jgi:hypothetical protein
VSILFERRDPLLRVTLHEVEAGSRTFFYPTISAVSLEQRTSSRAAGIALIIIGCAIELAVYGVGRLFQAVLQAPSLALPWFSVPTILIGAGLLLAGITTLLAARKTHVVRLHTAAGELPILATTRVADAREVVHAIRLAIRKHAGYDIEEGSKPRVLKFDNPAFLGTSPSAFISYGGPDEAFAAAIRDLLMHNDIKTFLFRDDAVAGERLHVMMWRGVNEFDVIVLVCSEASLIRSGVRNEIQETLAREAREGGASRLIPVGVDDYVFQANDELVRRIRDRVVLDFRSAEPQSTRFAEQGKRLVLAVRAVRPREHRSAPSPRSLGDKESP